MTIEQSEIRQERAALAAAAARSNLPTSVFILSLGLFAVAFIAMVWSMFARESAKTLLDARMAQATSIFKHVDEIKTLRAQIARAKDTRSNEPMFNVPLRLQQAATTDAFRVALSRVGPAKETTPGKDGTLIQKKFTINGITSESIDDVMAWIDKVQVEIKGLEVDSIDLTPAPNNWTISITFSRWEKKEG